MLPWMTCFPASTRIEGYGRVFVNRCLSRGVVQSGELGIELVDVVELEDAGRDFHPASYARQMDELRARFG